MITEKLDDKEKVTNNNTNLDIQIVESKTIANDNVSVSSVKSKKSGNLISNLIRKGRKKKINCSECRKGLAIDQECQSNDSFGSFKDDKDEVELGNQMFNEKNEENEPLKANISDSEYSIASTTSPRPKHRQSFLKRFMKRASSVDYDKIKQEESTKLTCDCGIDCPFQFETDFNSALALPSLNSKSQSQDSNNDTNLIPVAYIKHHSPVVEISLSDGLKQLQEVTKYLKESENHLMQIIIKFIQNQDFKKELIETISQYSLVQFEAERRTNSLANEMWIQQTEIFRCQEKTLQDTLFSLVHQNRLLQTDNEILSRRNEKLLIKLRNTPEYIRTKSFEAGNMVLENFAKNNEKQQKKIDLLINQVESFEQELNVMQKQNESLEETKNKNITEMENLKSKLQRINTDYDLEKASLNFQLKNSEQTVKDATESGELLMNEINLLKNQFKSMPSSLDWSKFKAKGTRLTDLVQLSRSCIHELSRELLGMYSQIDVKEKDNASLRETSSRLQENLKKCTVQLQSLSQISEEASTLKRQIQNVERKNSLLQNKISCLENEMTASKEKHQQDVQQSAEDKNKLNLEIQEINKCLDDSKLIITNLTAGNYKLQVSVDNLQTLVQRSGAGDVEKELTLSQEKLSFLQDQFYKLANEKNNLKEKLEKVRVEKKEYLEKQEFTFKHSQTIQNSLELLTNENRAMKEKLDEQYQTIFSLQSERKKYLDEKSVLKSVFTHLKSEVSRVQHLEGTVADISKEANRLAIIAEHNRKVGEKLKTDIEEKDNTILVLRSSVEKLNSVQIEHTKNNLGLCAELTEVNNIKEQLNNSLALEAKKVQSLNQKKKALENNSILKIKELKEIETKSKKELEEVLTDFSNIVRERNKLQNAQDNYKQQIEFLKSEICNHTKICDDITAKSNKTENKITDMCKKIEQQDKFIEELLEKIKTGSDRFEKALKFMDSDLKQASKDKENLEKSVEYLKNINNKLQLELNDSRTFAKDTEDKLQAETFQKALQGKELTDSNILNAKLTEEKHYLKSELDYVEKLCEKLLKDLDENVDASMNKELAFKNEMEYFQNEVAKYNNEKNQLKTIIEEKNKEKLMFQQKIENLEKANYELSAMNASARDVDQRLSQLKEEKRNVEEKLFNLQLDHGSCGVQIQNMKAENNRLRTEVDNLMMLRDQDNFCFKAQLDELFKEHFERKNCMDQDLEMLSNQLAYTKESLEQEKIEKQKLSTECKEVSSKLISTIENLFTEKANRREAEAKVAELKVVINNLKTEKEQLLMKTHTLITDAQEERNKITVLEKAKTKAQFKLEDVQRRYSEVILKCVNLENEVRSSQEVLQIIKNLQTYEDKLAQAELGQAETDETKIKRLNKELEDCYAKIVQQQEEISSLKQQLVLLELTKCEISLRLQETEGIFDTEHKMYQHLKQDNQRILTALFQMKEDGKVASSDYTDLLYRVHSLPNVNNTNVSVVEIEANNSFQPNLTNNKENIC